MLYNSVLECSSTEPCFYRLLLCPLALFRQLLPCAERSAWGGMHNNNKKAKQLWMG